MAVHVQLLLHQKLYEILNDDGDLADLIEGVFDNAPDNQKYPFVQIGNVSLDDFSAHTFDGFQGTFQIDVWSQSRTRKEAFEILNRIYTLLHNVNLGVTGFPTINCRAKLNEVLIDPDGVTYHGVQRYDVILGGN